MVLLRKDFRFWLKDGIWAPQFRLFSSWDLLVFCRIFYFLCKKNKDSPPASWNLEGFQQCPGSRSISRALLLLWAGDLLQRAGSKVCFGAGEWRGNFPTRNQKSTLILSWPVVYFSIAKINKAIFMLPLHKPVLQLKCWTRLNFVYKANCLLIRLPLMKPKRSISAKIQPSCGVEFFLFCF